QRHHSVRNCVELPRSFRPTPVRADCRGSDVVRDHLGRQRHRKGYRQQPREESRGTVVSSQIRSRAKSKPQGSQQDPDGGKKPEDMTTQTHQKSRLDSLTANRKPTWTWMAAATGSAILALVITLVAFESFSIIGFAIIGGVLFIGSM